MRKISKFILSGCVICFVWGCASSYQQPTTQSTTQSTTQPTTQSKQPLTEKRLADCAIYLAKSKPTSPEWKSHPEIRAIDEKITLAEEKLAHIRAEIQKLEIVESPTMSELAEQIDQLTTQLNELRKLCEETNPEILRLDRNILELDLKNQGLQRQVEQCSK